MLGAFLTTWTGRNSGKRSPARRRRSVVNPFELDRKSFEQQVARERIRASRRAIPFCILHLSLESIDRASGIALRASATKRLNNQAHQILGENLRSTDEYAQLGRRRFGILLVDTPEMGGRAVVDRLEGLFQDHDLKASIELTCHDPDGFGGDDDDGFFDDHQNGRSFKQPSSVKAWSAEGSLEVAGRLTDSAKVTDSLRCDPAMSPASVATPMNFSSMGEEQCGLATVAAPTSLESESDKAFCDNAAFVGRRHLDARRQSDPVASTLRLRYLPKPTLAKRLTKRTLDVSGAVFGLIAFAPVIAVAIYLIRRHDGQPAIFKQCREGRNGKPFTMYKLRTMVADAEATQHELRSLSHRDGPAFKIANDPRVTPIGDWLRRTCVDELPQLWNVLKGDMSLVGPRPLPLEESRACNQWQRRRLDVKPGMTCYWQVNKEAAPAFDDWMRLDLRYVEKFNTWEDLQLLARTVLVPLMGRGKE